MSKVLHSICGRYTLPKQMQEVRIVRQNYDLGGRLTAPEDLVDRVISTEAVHAGEGVVKDNDLACSICILLKLGKEKGKGQSAPVTATKRVLETRSIDWRVWVSQIDRVLIDKNLIARTRWPAAVGVGRCGDPEARVDPFEVPIDPLAILNDDLVGMGVAFDFKWRRVSELFGVCFGIIWRTTRQFVPITRLSRAASTTSTETW
jgi:hypothetical protein